MTLPVGVVLLGGAFLFSLGLLFGASWASLGAANHRLERAVRQIKRTQSPSNLARFLEDLAAFPPARN